MGGRTFTACVARAPGPKPEYAQQTVGGAVEIVLGVSMTPTTVSIALVEGEKADGVIIDHDVFEITAVDGAEPRAHPNTSSPRSSVPRRARSPQATIWCRPG